MVRRGVLVHYDPDGLVGPHVTRLASALAHECDDLVIVSTARLTDGARAELAALGRLVERENVGYDFYSWRAGLLAMPGWQDSDELVLANDSVIGPLVPMHQLLSRLRRRGLDLGGASLSHQFEPHVQSYFMVLSAAMLRSPYLQQFWLGMTPVSRRGEVIDRYELGLSHLAHVLGHRVGAYFEPGPRDRRVAALRTVRLAAQRDGRPVPDGLERRLLLRGPTPDTESSPVFSLWDRAITGRLPFVKVSLLRADPYRLGTETMLGQLERTHPRAFDGVRGYLDRTAASYSGPR